MKATILLMRQHLRSQRLLRSMGKNGRVRDWILSELADLVARHVAVEDTLLRPDATPKVARELLHHQAIHARVKLALFRITTSMTGDLDERHRAELEQALQAHALHESVVVRALEDTHDQATLERLGEEMMEAVAPRSYVTLAENSQRPRRAAGM